MGYNINQECKEHVEWLATYCHMCIQVLGDQKMNLSPIHSFHQVVKPGTIFYIIFTEYHCQPTQQLCDQWKAVKLYAPISTQTTKLSSFQDLKSVRKTVLGAPGKA